MTSVNCHCRLTRLVMRYAVETAFEPRPWASSITFSRRCTACAGLHDGNRGGSEIVADTEENMRVDLPTAFSGDERAKLMIVPDKWEEGVEPVDNMQKKLECL